MESDIETIFTGSRQQQRSASAISQANNQNTEKNLKNPRYVLFTFDFQQISKIYEILCINRTTVRYARAVAKSVVNH